MTMLKVATLENQLCFDLPAHLAAKLGNASGEEIATLDTDRGVELLKCDSEERLQMLLAAQIMEEDKEVLRRLAE